MNKVNCIFAVAGLVLILTVVYSDAVCCGSGDRGFCKDCSTVKKFGLHGAKCCGIGSGQGKGCNIFCCNCGGGKCKSGLPIISHTGGWWVNKRYTCTQGKGDSELLDVRSDLSETKEYFDSLDEDKDNCLSYEEFAEALRQHMNLLDSESSNALASNPLIDENQENLISLMDAAENVINLVRREFLKMDANGDGVIQAKEFDRDL